MRPEDHVELPIEATTGGHAILCTLMRWCTAFGPTERPAAEEVKKMLNQDFPSNLEAAEQARKALEEAQRAGMSGSPSGVWLDMRDIFI